ncbi:DUF2750 domain-containing protein [Actinoplanes utahensis]|uniref:DUF2750 domain-containing protein n=1 Tax=Actinoplanes utahensis TaxID=1869 RepID=UPI00068C2BA3|nr:DUF2750 domain-containing protein [Actinoplanes utahensis]GIF32606.1 hypothetical protein Aut01nite_55920 [Actinoplanes utahensis]
MASDDISRGEAQRLRGLEDAARLTRTFEIIGSRGSLWVWGDEDEVLFTEDGERRTLLPVWPHATVARLENEGEVAGEHAIEIRAGDFLTEWLPQLEEDDARIAVFPVEDRNAAVLDLADFRARLSAALR